MSERKRKKEAAEGCKERKPNWKEYMATVEDIQNFLMDRVLLRHNVITRRVEYRLPASYDSEGTDWQPVSDRIVNSLWAELSATKVVRAQDIYRVLESDYVPEFNPFTFYLQHLPPWDGDDYILAMSVSVSGTGNNMQFLSDPTGNRRWLPFEVESIESPREKPFEYEGIYAQAYALYKQGFQFWFSRDEILKLAEHNRQFETPRLETELVQQYFRKPVGQEPGEFMPVSLALQIVGAGITQKLSTVSLGRAFMEQGFERRTFRNVRGYVVVRRTMEEMKTLRSVMARGRGDTDTDVTDVF